MANKDAGAGGKIFEGSDGDQKMAKLENYSSYGELILERIEEKEPDRVVWIQGDTGIKITGREVAKRVRNIACGLLDTYNIKPQSIFMIDDRNTIEMCVLANAIICVAGIPFFIDKGEARVELARQARQLEPTFYFCSRKDIDRARLMESASNNKVTAILTDPELSCEDKGSFNYLYNYDHSKSNSNSLVPLACVDIHEDLAGLCLSSGTTGVPKPVAFSHARLLMEGVEERRLPTAIRLLSPSVQETYSSQSFAAFPILCPDVTTVLLENATISGYLDAVGKYKISAIYLGAVIFSQLLEEYRLNKEKYDLSSVYLAVPFGAKVNFRRELEQFFKENPQIRFLRTMYASTESGRIAVRSVPPLESLKDIENCGQLLPGVKMKIIDPDLYDSSGEQRLLGYDQMGLILVKTNTLFTGYLDKCQARLANNIPACPAPFPRNISPYRSDQNVFDSDGFYMTDDLGFVKSGTNELYIRGRRKEVIETQSHYKVMPQELEEILHQHPAVHIAIVFGVHDRSRSFEYFRGFIMLKKGVASVLTREQLKSYLIPNDGCDYGSCCDIEDGFMFKGTNTLSSMADSLRRHLLANIHRYLSSLVNSEKRFRAGLAIVDEIPTMRETGKADKKYLKSLGGDEVEFYCQNVELHQETRSL